jgi:hypothetical protein
MKRVIEGKIYNTDTATAIASFDSGHHSGDFDAERETLYVTKKGSYFIAGEGGANSRWAHHSGRGRCAGSDIVVITKSEALNWCETHKVSADVISGHFDLEEA